MRPYLLVPPLHALRDDIFRFLFCALTLEKQMPSFSLASLLLLLLILKNSTAASGKALSPAASHLICSTFVEETDSLLANLTLSPPWNSSWTVLIKCLGLWPRA